MQYFKALNVGRKRVEDAKIYLDKITDGRGMPAMALADSVDNSWNPVGEEILYAFVDESSGFVLTDNSGYILALVDSRGYSKAVATGILTGQRKEIESMLSADNIKEYTGRVILPA
ncbi:MAG: hypothetical protein F4Y82_05590 [Cenarchaeum sp. SB0665_bin_23]|nr:hypothetical protein [Cenarchaeum sp. SB0667_bin_13]MXY61564.1 hypothetical protein [Cenarchaeum sp. SB0665_bin_23]MXZ92951.1 hypothetical protein [Cenarchaeum sp. SB0666_bin_15]MYB47312.1 hypothetical protein [Cenarchaeum sp. SB0662_bin_33]MYC80071.1 hypothetical protein [Cenarchaeum sp. SB0661_bin_35]MYD59359.1 hypothetical protein [Cenarchaeum sp. SB0678_bin_8]MYG33518.1 hypothetical protein [Cenarchaeum sp. SB0677_bin_16]